MNQTGALPSIIRVLPLLMTAALVGCAPEADEGVANDGQSVLSDSSQSPEQSEQSEQTEQSQQALGNGRFSAGCFNWPRPAVTSVSVDFGGETRTALVHQPAPRRFPLLNLLGQLIPRPVVISFHGAGGSKEFQAGSDGMIDSSDDNGFIVVHPQASGPQFYNLWGVNLFTGQPIDDVGYIRAMLDKLGQVACIDKQQVFAAGLSNGAWMTENLACNASDIISGIAPIASTGFTCGHATNVPTIGFHGIEDAVAPYAGVPGAVIPTMDQWNSIATNNGCSLPAKVERINSTVEKLTYKKCKADTVFYRLSHQGHSWPGQPFEGASADYLATMLGVWQAVAWPLPWVTPADATASVALNNTTIDATAKAIKFFAMQ